MTEAISLDDLDSASEAMRPLLLDDLAVLTEEVKPMPAVITLNTPLTPEQIRDFQDWWRRAASGSVPEIPFAVRRSVEIPDDPEKAMPSEPARIGLDLVEERARKRWWRVWKRG